MSGKVVGGYVRRSNLRLLLIALAGLVVAGLFAPFAWTAVVKASRGPIALDAAALKAAVDPKERPTGFVVVTGDKAFRTGFVYQKDGKTEDEDVLIRVGDQFLLTTTRSDPHSVTVFGYLTPHTEYQASTVIPALENETPQLRGKILPYSLSGTFREELTSFAITLCIPPMLGASAAVVLLLLLLFLNRSRESHPFVRSLARFGTPEEVAASIDEEADAGATETVRGVLLTPSWLVCPVNARQFDVQSGTGRVGAAPPSGRRLGILPLLFGQFSAFRLVDLLWAYKTVPTKRSSRGCALRLYDRDGCRVEIPSRTEGELDQIVAWLCKFAPWVLLNFKQEYETSWLQDRPALAALVDQRRRELPPAAALPHTPLLERERGGGLPVPLSRSPGPQFLERIKGTGSWDNLIGRWLARGGRRLIALGVVGFTFAAASFALVIFGMDHPLGNANSDVDDEISIVSGLGFSAVGISALCFGIAWQRRPELHPIGRTLNRFGNPAAVAEAVEVEARGKETAAAGRVLLTSSWLICPHRAIHAASEYPVVDAPLEGRALFYGVPAALAWLLGPFSVFRLRDLVWTYKLAHHAGKKGSSVLRLCDRHGYRVEISSRDEAELDQIVTWVRQHAPWVLLNYRTDWDSYWKTNRPALAALVDQRRRDLEAEA